MENILILAASGNVSREIIRHFVPAPHQRVWTTTRSVAATTENQVYFDFENIAQSAKSLEAMDVVFLLRPPELSDVAKYFSPLIAACLSAKVKHVIFLSVQGADAMAIIPHAKIEKLIVQSKIAYTFMRPSYFMQNLTTLLLQDIRDNKRIALPAGHAGFLYVDLSDVGKAIAAVLESVTKHQNKIHTLTGNEVLSFKVVAQKLSKVLHTTIAYNSVNPITFYLQKRKEKTPTAMIAVMFLLHFLPRFQGAPKIFDDIALLTKQRPTTLDEFLEAHADVFLSRTEQGVGQAKPV